MIVEPVEVTAEEEDVETNAAVLREQVKEMQRERKRMMQEIAAIQRSTASSSAAAPAKD